MFVLLRLFELYRKLKEEPEKDALSIESIRQQAFFGFDIGMRPSDMISILGIKDGTAYRYFQQLKKLPPLFTAKYKLARQLFRKLNQDDRSALAKVLASQLRTSDEEVLNQMRKPWAVRQIVTGKWRQWLVKVTYTRTPSILKRALQEFSNFFTTSQGSEKYF